MKYDALFIIIALLLHFDMCLTYVSLLLVDLLISAIFFKAEII